jgi:hypothetical protein
VAVDEAIGHRALRAHGPKLALESSLRGARASAAVEGVNIDLEFLRSGNVRLDHPGRPIAQAALRLAQEVPLVEDVWRRAPVQALARLHVVAAADDAPPRDSSDSAGLGRPRDAESAQMLQALARWIATDTSTPAVVVAAIAHGQIAAFEPFGSRDAVVARSVERLVVRTRGLDPRGVCITETGHALIGRTAYLQALADFRTGSVQGAVNWVVHCAESIAHGAREIVAVADALAQS